MDMLQLQALFVFNHHTPDSTVIFSVASVVQEEQEKTQFKAKKMQTKASSILDFTAGIATAVSCQIHQGTAELEETKAEKESDVKYSTDLSLHFKPEAWGNMDEEPERSL